MVIASEVEALRTEIVSALCWEDRVDIAMDDKWAVIKFRGKSPPVEDMLRLLVLMEKQGFGLYCDTAAGLVFARVCEKGDE